MKTEAVHVVYISNRRLASEWQGEKQVGEIVFRTIDHEKLPLAVGRDVFYGSSRAERDLTFTRDNPRSTLRRLRVAKVLSIDWKRRRVTLQESEIKLTIDFNDLARATTEAGKARFHGYRQRN
jgi:hypothetical protein